MSQDEFSKMIGNHKILASKDYPVEHSLKNPAGMARGMREAADDVAEALMPKRRS